MSEAFVLNNPTGTFLVKAQDGSIAFDSRLATQRLYLVGTADVTGPASQSVTFTTLLIPFGKTFTKVPYVRSAARLIDGQTAVDQGKNFYPPQMTWSTVGSQQFFFGNYTAAGPSGVYLGNAMQNGAPRGRLRFLYAIFENPVE